MLAQQLTELQGDEGLRLLVYDDATGKPIGPGTRVIGHPTIGWGRCLDLHGLSEAEAHALLSNDIAVIEAQLQQAFPWWSSLDAVRQGAITNLTFGVGLAGVKKFTHMLAALAARDYNTAANELNNSLWAAQVQHSRSSRLIAELRTGDLPIAGA
jgi:GH24 family phage-related lysozyme (muramidase)